MQVSRGMARRYYGDTVTEDDAQMATFWGGSEFGSRRSNHRDERGERNAPNRGTRRELEPRRRASPRRPNVRTYSRPNDGEKKKKRSE